jgi:hypothetical protein
MVSITNDHKKNLQQTYLNLFILFLQPIYWMVNGIIADPEVLEEEYIPQNIPCREARKKDLAFYLSPIEKGMKSLDCLCHGKPETGKTALVKYILQLVFVEQNSPERKVKVFIPMYEPLQFSKCGKCRKIIAQPKELIRIVKRL